MDAPNSKAHTAFVIASVIAVPAGAALALLTTVMGIEIPAPYSFLDLAPPLALLGAGLVAGLSLLMLAAWFAIYRKTPGVVWGLRIWTVLFGVMFAMNAVVFNGFIQRILTRGYAEEPGPGYSEAIRHLHAQAEGFVIWAQFWPLVVIVWLLMQLRPHQRVAH